MASFDISYTYDGVGNRLPKVDAISGESVTYTYDAAHRLTREESSVSGVTTYTYDASGNRTRKTSTTFFPMYHFRTLQDANQCNGCTTRTSSVNWCQTTFVVADYWVTGRDYVYRLRSRRLEVRILSGILLARPHFSFVFAIKRL